MGLFLLTWACSTLGFIGLSMTMEKHQKQYFTKVLSSQKTKLAQLGWVFLLASLGIALAFYGIADGVSYWVGVLSFSGLFVLAMLSYFAQHVKIVSIGVGVLACIGLILVLI